MKNKERDENDIVTQAPIEVILGGKKWPIKPLVIREAREWRRKYAEVTAPLFGVAGATAGDVGEFGDIYKGLLTTSSDDVIDLFFMYAKDLNRKEIESIATEEELSHAFEAIVELALPLALSLPRAIGRKPKEI